MVGKPNLAVGQVYVFPLRQLVPPYEPNGYFAAGHLIGQKPDGMIVTGLEWTGTHAPSLAELIDKPLIRLTQGKEANEIVVVWEVKDTSPEAILVGSFEPDDEEVEAITCHCKTRYCTCKRTQGGWKAFSAMMRREWRKRLDPAGFETDVNWIRSVLQEQRNKQLADERNELENTTLESLKTEDVFKEWSRSISDDTIHAVRDAFHQTADSLIQLGDLPPQREKIRILKKFIETINHLNSKHQFIGTNERETLCKEFNRLTLAAGLKGKNLADKWRDW